MLVKANEITLACPSLVTYHNHPCTITGKFLDGGDRKSNPFDSGDLAIAVHWDINSGAYKYCLTAKGLTTIILPVLFVVRLSRDLCQSISRFAVIPYIAVNHIINGEKIEVSVDIVRRGQTLI